MYLGLHDTLAETISDPSFHKTAAEMGEATYAPVHFKRPDLGTAPTLEDTAVPAAVDNVDTDVLSAEVREPGGASRGDDGAQLDPSDYGANRDAINEQAGQGDYVHAPQDQPSGLSHEDYDPDDLIATANANANANEMQRGYVQTYMDTVAQIRGDAFKQEFMADNPGPFNIDNLQNVTDKAAMRARVDAANQMWGQIPAVDQRPLRQWDYRPQGTRSWKSLKQQGGDSVRFGGARQINFLVELDVDETAKLGRPYRVATEPTNTLDVSQAVRQVPTPTDWKYWKATRQGGFGRTASVSGEFPFSVREKMLNTLMQGKRFQPGTDAHDALERLRALGYHHGYAASGPHANTWTISVASLVRDLGSAIKYNELRAPTLTEDFVRNLDAATLGRMLLMLEVGRLMA